MSTDTTPRAGLTDGQFFQLSDLLHFPGVTNMFHPHFWVSEGSGEVDGQVRDCFVSLIPLGAGRLCPGGGGAGGLVGFSSGLSWGSLAEPKGVGGGSAVCRNTSLQVNAQCDQGSDLPEFLFKTILPWLHLSSKGQNNSCSYTKIRLGLYGK